MICIIGVGILLSVRTKFVQIRKFPYAIKSTFLKMFKKTETKKSECEFHTRFFYSVGVSR